MIKRLKVIERDFILKPNPYISDEQSLSALWKLAVGQTFAISSVFSVILMKVGKPKFAKSPIWRNFTFFQASTSMALLFYHYYDLSVLGQLIPQSQIEDKLKTFDERYNKKT